MNKQAEETFCKGILLENEAEFEKAGSIYKGILHHASDEAILGKARSRMEDMNDLIAEKAVYQRIDENAKQVLTEIGINVSDNQTLMDLLMEADAVDFDNETSVFIPLKREYIDQCLSQVPRQMPLDPGMNTFGIGATPPFLKRTGDDELRPANRKEYEKIAATVGECRDVTGIFSLPVACDKSISLFEVADLMEKNYHGLKMITTNTMSNDQVAFFKGRADWVDGSLSYSSPHQTFINAAMARINTWITHFPSAQTGGSTSLSDVTSQALADSELSRNSLRKYGVHIVRHALGALGSLNFFSLEKFLDDCERERRSREVFNSLSKDQGMIPLYFPDDNQALAQLVTTDRSTP